MDALDLMGLPYLFDQCNPGLTAAAGGRYLRFDFLVYYGTSVVVVEFDGEQHERPATFGGMPAEQAAEAFLRQKESDAIKDEHCAAMGYHLLRIRAADLMRAPRLIGDFFRERLGWAPGRPLPPDTPALPRAPAVPRTREPRAARRANAARSANELAYEVFTVLGAEPCVEALTVEPAALLAAPVLELAGRINRHASRLFNDGDGARRAKTLAAATDAQGGYRRRCVASSLNAALTHVGAELRPEYKTARAKKRGTPAAYVLRWIHPPPNTGNKAAADEMEAPNLGGNLLHPRGPLGGWDLGRGCTESPGCLEATKKPKNA
jgi:hypothetical protein